MSTSLQITTKNTDDEFVITVVGNFNSLAHRDIRKAGEEALKSDHRIISIDLEKVPHLDSSALGMLMLLREEARAANKEITLSHCQGHVLDVLKSTRFYELFTIQ